MRGSEFIFLSKADIDDEISIRLLMKKISQIIEKTNWIVASPTSDSVGIEAEILVSREAVRRVRNLVRTYVLINYSHQQSMVDDRGINQFYISAVYRKDLSEKTGLARVSAIAFFTEPFAKGRTCVSFFYPHERWEYAQEGLPSLLTQFMLNNAPIDLSAGERP